MNLELAQLFDDQVWGQGFPAPAFCDTFNVVEQRIVGGHHLRLRLRRSGTQSVINAMRFGDDTSFPDQVSCVYRLQVNEFNGSRTPQLVIDHWQPV